MVNFRKRWRPSTLFASWIVYWIVLGAVTLTPAIRAILRATQAGDGKGNVSISFGGGVLNLVVNVNGRAIYTGAVHFITLALLIGGPPLILYALWLMQRPRRAPEPDRERVM
jgi:hypothetical protein